MKNMNKFCKDSKNKKVCEKIRKLCKKGHEKYATIEMGQTNGIPTVSTKVAFKCKL